MNPNNTTTKKNQSVSAHKEAGVTHDLELLLVQARDTIEIPSREQFRPLFDRVTKNQLSRYKVRKSSFVDAWMSYFHTIPRAAIISGMVSLAIIIIMIIPTAPATPDISQTFISNEIDQEVLLLDQENTIIDTVIDTYFQQYYQVANY